jgi:hypothetical protein
MCLQFAILDKKRLVLVSSSLFHAVKQLKALPWGNFEHLIHPQCSLIGAKALSKRHCLKKHCPRAQQVDSESAIKIASSLSTPYVCFSKPN